MTDAAVPRYPRYPIYVPSRGRARSCKTAEALLRDRVPFWLVVEAAEVDAYRSALPDAPILPLPGSDYGSVVFARNAIRDHAAASGAARHWQIDDNVFWFERVYEGRRIPCNAGVALRAVEDLADRYENVGVAGLNYHMFGMAVTAPVTLNCHVYSCCLIDHAMPFRWRGRRNEDTDLCLQALSGGWCTLLVNVFLVWKLRTMAMQGGNTDALYAGDGRLRMARELERRWPGVVTTRRRFKRPQHVVADAWTRFTVPLIPKPGLPPDPAPDEYGLSLRAVPGRAVKSPAVRDFLARMGRAPGTADRAEAGGTADAGGRS